MADLPLDAISISDLARKRGVSKQAIHKRVGGLVADGRLTTYSGPMRSVMVSASAYDFAVGQTGDPVKEASAASAAVLRGAEDIPLFTRPPVVVAPQSSPDGPLPEGETMAYRDAKARDAHYAAEMKRLNFELLNKQLYQVTEVDAAMVRLAGVVREATKGMVSRAEDGAEALEKGMPAFRRWLGQLGDDICRTIAAEWRVLASDAEAGIDTAPDMDDAADAEDGA